MLKRNLKVAEAGRNMVEMLGILAIVGIISIGGIVGYRQALAKHGANDLMSIVGTMATAASLQMDMGEPLDLEEFRSHTLSRYTFTVERSNEHMFSITLSDVPQDVCNQVMTARWELPYETVVNGFIGRSCEQPLNTMRFNFVSTLNNPDTYIPSVLN